MAYIGVSPSNGVRNRFQYQATAGQTSFSGSDANSLTLSYTDSLYMDVYQNGILLVQEMTTLQLQVQLSCCTRCIFE